MALGFLYRGKHSRRDFNIKFKSKTRPVMPPVKVVTEEITNADSLLDYTEATGRAYYSDKVLELDLFIEETDLFRLHKKVARVVSWLQGGWGDLIFDDMPSVKWICRPVNFDSFSMELMRLGRATVQFRCKPFNVLLKDSTPILLGDKVPLGSNIPLGSGNNNTFTFNGGDGITVSINNLGDAPTRPIITVSGNFETFGLVNQTQPDYKVSDMFHYPNAFTYLTIDCQKMICKDNIGTNMTANALGEFLELLPGINQIFIGGNGSGTVSFKFDYNYFYCD